MTKGEKSRLKILERVYEFLEEGKIPAMREIARRSGMGLGSLYYHFDSLDRIFSELDGLIYSRMVDGLRSEIGTEEDPLFLFIAAETLRMDFLANRPVYFRLFKQLPASALFSGRRIKEIEGLLDSAWERADEEDAYRYLGLLTSLYVRMDKADGYEACFDSMERLFMYFFQDNVDVWELTQVLEQVRQGVGNESGRAFIMTW